MHASGMLADTSTHPPVTSDLYGVICSLPYPYFALSCQPSLYILQMVIKMII